MAPPRYRYHDSQGTNQDQEFLESHYENNKGRITRTEISDADTGGASAPKQHTSGHTIGEASPSTNRKVPQPQAGQSDIVSSSQPEDIEMGLPGTAKGQGGSGDGNANSGMPLYRSVTPNTNFNSKTTSYRKVHRLMSFGLAHTFLNGTSTTTPTETQRFLMTYLAEIPWNKPYFYMTPGEYNILGPNAKCKSLKISIVHRGNRIAFETASSASGLATLNNIQNIAVAYGLNKTGFGVNVRPTTFVTGEPMRVSGFATDENNQPYINSWYGFPQNDANWGTEIPDVMVGYKSLLRRYFAMISSNTNTQGDPMLAKHLMFMDGKTTINSVVGEFEYHPKMAPLKFESTYQRYGLPTVDDSQSTLNIEGNLHKQQTLTLDMNNSTPTAQFVEGDQLQRTLNNSSFIEANAGANSFYLRDIEKAHFMRNGVWGDAGDKATLQPSVHVGIQAIPALSTDSLAAGPTFSYTDSQADWEIVAEMVVDEGLGVDFAWATRGNKAFGDITMVTTDHDTYSCVVGGRHPINPVRAATYAIVPAIPPFMADN